MLWVGSSYNGKNRPALRDEACEELVNFAREQGDWQTNLGGFENQIGSFMTGLTMLTNPTRSPDDRSHWPQTKIPISALYVCDGFAHFSCRARLGPALSAKYRR